MKTLDEVLELISLDRGTLETYIERQWVRPERKKKEWYFEDIDIARLQLICHLTQDIEVNDNGMDVALSLLDQLYALRSQMRLLTHAINRQPAHVRKKITFFANRLADLEDD